MLRAKAALFLALGLLLFVLSGVACESEGLEVSGTPAADLTGLTLEDAFSRLAEAITRPGFVFHAKIEAMARTPDGESRPGYTNEVWIDLTRDAGRLHFRKAPEWEADIAEESAAIITGGTAYHSGYDDAFETTAEVCPGTESPVLSLILDCGSTPETPSFRPIDRPFSFRVEPDAEYDGERTIALVFERTALNELRAEPPSPPGMPTTQTPTVVERVVVSRFYLQPQTFLPVAWVTQFFEEDEKLAEIVAAYETEFVVLDSLPTDFFDPAAIGYVVEDPEALLDELGQGVAVYWLGREFTGQSGLPSLVLARSYAATTPGSSPGNYAQIEYETTQGSVAVLLLLWRLEDWEKFLETPLGRLWWDSPCIESKEVQFDTGRAVILMGYEPEGELPPGPATVRPGEEPPSTATPQPSPTLAVMGCPTGRDFDRFMAHVYFGDIVVAVNTPLCLSCVGRPSAPRHPDPYDSLDGMEAVVRGLTVRVPR